MRWSTVLLLCLSCGAPEPAALEPSSPQVLFEYRRMQLDRVSAGWFDETVAIGLLHDADSDPLGELLVYRINGELRFSKAFDFGVMSVGVGRDRVYAMLEDGRLFAYDLEGAEVWTRDFGTGFYGRLSVSPTDGSVAFYIDADRQAYWLDRDGEQRSAFSVPQATNGHFSRWPVFGEDGRLVITENLVKVSFSVHEVWASGQVRSEVVAQASARGVPLVTDEGVYLTVETSRYLGGDLFETSDEFELVSIKEGEISWRAPIEGDPRLTANTSVVRTTDRVFVITDRCDLQAFRLDGRAAWSGALPAEDPDFSCEHAVGLAIGDTLYIQLERTLYSLDSARVFSEMSTPIGRGIRGFEHRDGRWFEASPFGVAVFELPN